MNNGVHTRSKPFEPRRVKMSNDVTKFNYNSSHNNFPAIESLNPLDIGTEKQFRFTAKMLCDMFQVAKNTIYSRIEILENTGDLSVQNFELIKLLDSNGRAHETKIYDLTVLNKLAMTMIDNPIAVNVRKAFNDVIVKVETTGQYSIQPTVPQTYLEALKALVASEEEKEQLRLTNETLRGKLDDMGDELEIAKSEMFTNKQVFEIVRDRFTLNYADSTLKNKLSKALKAVSSELNERIFYNKVTVNDVVRTTPYYTKTVVNRLLSYIDKDCNYLKSFK